MPLTPKPDFATNRPGERVADALAGFLGGLAGKWADPPEVAIATAYFNPGGFGLLADALEACGSVRILLGAEPEQRDRLRRPLSDPASPARAARARLQRSLEGHSRTMAEDRDLLGFTTEADATARRLVAWLESGDVQVRRLENGFLHGKAFMVTTDNEGVIAGSSNFTYAGLATNIELNLGRYDPHVVGQVADWYEDLWGQAEPFDLAGFYRTRFEEHPPYLVFLRMLWERYGTELDQEAEDTEAPKIKLTTFQRDGLWRAQRILDDHHGVVIADEVGLGKTFLAGELIRRAVEERRQRVLLIAPATLRDGPWAKFFDRHNLNVRRVSFEQLADDKRLNPETGTGVHLGDYWREFAMVVVDEAHNLRNPSTLRANALRRLLAGSPPRDLVLLTATPVNNSLWDLYYLLGYFLRNDAVFADAGIKSLRDHFATAMAMNPDDLSPEHLFDILDAIAVRRTREFVKTYYRNDTVEIDGKHTPIVFPTPRVRKVSYDLDAVLPGFFERFEHALDGTPTEAGDPTVLTLARYAPSQYRLDNDVEAHEVQLAGLLRSGLLKRFESSAHAFASTCRKMAASHDAFLSLLDSGRVGTGAALADWVATDSDDIDQVDAYQDRHVDGLDDAEEYDQEALALDVAADRDLLLAFADEAALVTQAQDPKLQALVEEIAAIAAEAAAEGVGETDERDKRKILIFSYFADTVDWVAQHLAEVVERDDRLAAYRGRVVAISGGSGNKDDVLWGFAPRTTDAPEGRDDDLYDIVVATDVLAEGVNLQQARHILNYDLPWNPMRLVQRHGRIDRIGSTHAEVFLRCVFPDAQLDDLLGLEARLHAKIAQAAAAVGVVEVLPGSKTNEVNLADTREEIERLRQEDAALFERGATSRSALSGEEYRQALREAIDKYGRLPDIQGLPWGSGSGMAVQRPYDPPGYVFFARVADHPRPMFRFISTAEGAEPVRDTLACLDLARPIDGWDTVRDLDEATYAGAYGAWATAMPDIVAEWNKAADPANLAPAVPLAMHRAAELVREHKPPEMTQEAAEYLIDSLQTPWPERVVRLIRAALGTNQTPVDQVRLVNQTATELGLEPSPPPEPLPEITADDVHLVCWLAINPGGETIAEQIGELPLGDRL